MIEGIPRDEGQNELKRKNDEDLNGGTAYEYLKIGEDYHFDSLKQKGEFDGKFDYKYVELCADTSMEKEGGRVYIKKTDTFVMSALLIQRLGWDWKSYGLSEVGEYTPREMVYVKDDKLFDIVEL